MENIFDSEKFEIDTFDGEISPKYRKITPEQLEYISPVLKEVITSVIEQTKKNAINESFQNAIKDSYIVKMPSLLHLGHSHETEGAFSGMCFDETNKFRRNAEWLKNTATLEFPVPLEIVQNIFNGLAFVTGQYFMAKINSKMSAIEKELSKIEQRMERKELSEIRGKLVTLKKDIIPRLEYIKLDPEKRQSILNELEQYRRFSNEIIDEIKNVLREKHKILKDNKNKKDKHKEIERKINECIAYLQKYHSVILIRLLTELIEVQIRQSISFEEIDHTKKRICEIVGEYTSEHEQMDKILNYYINNNNYLNEHFEEDISLPLHIHSKINSWDDVILAGFSYGIVGFAESEWHKFKNTQRNTIKSNLLNSIKEKLDSIHPKLIKDTIKIIDMQTSPIEIIYKNDEYYLNFLES